MFLIFSPDPYARVVFLNHSQVTHAIHRTLCPTWDQTLVFEEVFIFGSTELLQLKPPEVVIELFDKDQVVSIKLRTFNKSKSGFLWVCTVIEHEMTSKMIQTQVEPRAQRVLQNLDPFLCDTYFIVVDIDLSLMVVRACITIS